LPILKFIIFIGAVIFVFLASPGQAQETLIQCTDSTFCIPNVFGLPRAKGLIVKYERVMDFGITSTGQKDSLGDGQGEVRRNRRWEVQLRLPIVRNPGFKMAVGFRYFNEEYEFEEDDPAYPFYQSLQDKPLKSIGGQIFMAKPFKGNKYLLLRLSGDFNGDYTLDDEPLSDFLKFSIIPLFGWKTNPYTAYAVGVAYSNDFGRQQVFPVFSFIQTWNQYWGIEALLPSKVRIRYTPNDKTNIYGGAELNGASYTVRLDDPVLSEFSTLNLRKSEIRFLLNLEREIHDWLWFGIQAGVRTNIQFNLREDNTRNATEIIDNDFNAAFVFNTSIFIVPPRRFLE